MVSTTFNSCHGALRLAGLHELQRQSRRCFAGVVSHASRTAGPTAAGATGTGNSSSSYESQDGMFKGKLQLPMAINPSMWSLPGVRAWAPSYSPLPDELPHTASSSSGKQQESISFRARVKRIKFASAAPITAAPDNATAVSDGSNGSTSTRSSGQSKGRWYIVEVDVEQAAWDEVVCPSMAQAIRRFSPHKGPLKQAISTAEATVPAVAAPVAAGLRPPIPRKASSNIARAVITAPWNARTAASPSRVGTPPTAAVAGQGAAVARVTPETWRDVVVTGCLGDTLRVGDTLSVQGCWEWHQRYGLQIKAEIVSDEEFEAIENAIRAAEAASRQRDIEDAPLDLVRFKTDLFNVTRPFGPYRQQFSLSVTELTSSLWCGLQLAYQVATGVPKRTTAVMAKGTEQHEAIEAEIVETVEVELVSREDALAVQLLNTVAAIRQLVGTGRTRELRLYANIWGQWLVGVIDGLELDPETHTVTLTETKTRAQPNLPSESQITSNKLQVMLYREMYECFRHLSCEQLHEYLFTASTGNIGLNPQSALSCQLLQTAGPFFFPTWVQAAQAQAGADGQAVRQTGAVLQAGQADAQLPCIDLTSPSVGAPSQAKVREEGASPAPTLLTSVGFSGTSLSAVVSEHGVPAHAATTPSSKAQPPAALPGVDVGHTGDLGSQPHIHSQQLGASQQQQQQQQPSQQSAQGPREEQPSSQANALLPAQPAMPVRQGDMSHAAQGNGQHQASGSAQGPPLAVPQAHLGQRTPTLADCITLLHDTIQFLPASGTCHKLEYMWQGNPDPLAPPFEALDVVHDEGWVRERLAAGLSIWTGRAPLRPTADEWKCNFCDFKAQCRKYHPDHPQSNPVTNAQQTLAAAAEVAATRRSSRQARGAEGDAPNVLS